MTFSKFSRSILAGLTALFLAGSALAADVTLKLGHLANEENI